MFLELTDYINLQKVLRRIKPEDFDEAAVAVALHSKLAEVIRHIQLAQLDQEVKKRAEQAANVGTQNDLSSGD